jgi:predicted metalloprotease
VRWRRGQSSDYVIDRRGARRTGGIAVGGLGGIGVLVVLLLQLFGGGGGGGVPGIEDIVGQLGAPAGGTDPSVVQGTEGAADDEDEDFMRAVMNDLNIAWSELFADENLTYETTSLVLFTDAVSTGCGQASAATGPFYCPPDRLAYIDLSFFDELRTRFGAPGEFAEAYVIAHEVGHHVQNLLGVLEARRSNEDSVRVELQADCYAGVWANGVFEQGDLEDGDIEEALGAAAAVGDDRIQPGSSPESWTHGSSEQRMRWFQAGYRSGDPDACDTFNAAEL